MNVRVTMREWDPCDETGYGKMKSPEHVAEFSHCGDDLVQIGVTHEDTKTRYYVWVSRNEFARAAASICPELLRP